MAHVEGRLFYVFLNGGVTGRLLVTASVGGVEPSFTLKATPLLGRARTTVRCMMMLSMGVVLWPRHGCTTAYVRRLVGLCNWWRGTVRRRVPTPRSMLCATTTMTTSSKVYPATRSVYHCKPTHWSKDDACISHLVFLD